MMNMNVDNLPLQTLVQLAFRRFACAIEPT